MNEDCEMLWDTFLLLHQLSLVVFVYEFLHSFFCLGVYHALPGILAFLELNLCIFDFTFSCEVPSIGKSTSFLSFLFCCMRVQVVYIFMISMLKSFHASPFPINAHLLVRSHHSVTKEGSAGTERELRFFAGDWSKVHLCLPHVHEKEMDLSCSSGHKSCSQ